MHHYNFIEIPLNSGQPKLGVAKASRMMYEKLEEVLKKSDVTYTHERIPGLVIDEYTKSKTMLEGALVSTKNAKINGSANERISQRIINKIQPDSVTVALGGDHSLALGTVHGHAEHIHNRGAELAVIWVDAHADINVPAHSGSGNLHGMPLGFLTQGIQQQFKPNRTPGHTWIKDPRVKMSNLVYIGLRDVDDFEVELLRKENVLAFYMEDVRRLGIKEVMRIIFNHIQLGPNKKLHLSYDIDGMDPSIAPSTGTSVNGGLTLEEGLHIMQAICDQGHLEVVDMVEVNPTIGSNVDAEKTVTLAQILLLVVMGLMTEKKGCQVFNALYPTSSVRRHQ